MGDEDVEGTQRVVDADALVDFVPSARESVLAQTHPEEEEFLMAPIERTKAGGKSADEEGEGEDDGEGARGRGR